MIWFAWDIVSGGIWTEWHLTPRGWERGSRALIAGEVLWEYPAPDRVLTVRCYHPSARRSNAQPQEEVWRSLDIELVESLLRLHGRPEDRGD